MHKGLLAVCDFCRQFITPLTRACYICAYPLASDGYARCGHCIKTPPAFDHSLIGYIFEEPLRSLLHEFKYNNGFYLAPFFADLMLSCHDTNSSKPQCLIPVPMHPQRIKQRGFNQAAILSKLLAKILKIPCNLTHCKKIINTAPQATLDAEARQKNLKNAFLTTPLPYQHVAIIDDLLTTGGTVNELALSLKKSGVAKVDVWCCARAIIKSV